jgi:hypothetical protein
VKLARANITQQKSVIGDQIEQIQQQIESLQNQMATRGTLLEGKLSKQVAFSEAEDNGGETFLPKSNI